MQGAVMQGVRHAGKRRGYALPPSSLDAAQVVCALSASADGAHVAVLVEGVACLGLDLALARKTNSDANVWAPCIPGTYPSAMGAARCRACVHCASVLAQHAGYHTDAVVCLSVATRRPLVVTAGADRTVRVFDAARQVCLACLQLRSPVTAVAMHPWGTELVVATKEGAHSYVIANELLCGHRLDGAVGGFSRCMYSRPGGLLACAQRATICVYSATEYALLATLRGHPNDVLSMHWSCDGVRLASVCREAVYTWSMESFSKVEEDTERAHANAAVATDATFARVLVANGSNGLRVFGTCRADAEAVAAARHGGVETSSGELEGGTRAVDVSDGEVPALRLLTRCAPVSRGASACASSCAAF